MILTNKNISSYNRIYVLIDIIEDEIIKLTDELRTKLRDYQEENISIKNCAIIQSHLWKISKISNDLDDILIKMLDAYETLEKKDGYENEKDNAEKK